MDKTEKRREKVLIVMGSILLICAIALGAFVFPIGLPICASIGIAYSRKYHDKLLLKWSLIGLVVGLLCLVYTLYLISGM